jgi:hypothetical protein
MKTRLVSAIALGLALSAAVYAQDPATPAPAAQNPAQGAGSGGGQGQRGGRGGGFGGGAGMGLGRGVLGTVTEVAADHYTVKNDAGETYVVHFSVNTRIMKMPQRRGPGGGGDAGDPQQNAPQPLKPTDIKVGDAITAGGEVDTAAKSVGAVIVMLLDPERAKQMREMQANYGKTWLMGKVTAIDGVKVTLAGSVDNASHSFVADENTTFRKRRDPITLADVQVGDMVRIEGAVKDGGFVATTVTVMGPPQGPGQGAAPPAAPPAPQPK